MNRPPEPGPKAPPRPAVLSAPELRMVLIALDETAERRRADAAACRECDDSPESGLCPECEWRLQGADIYEALAERLRRQQ